MCTYTDLYTHIRVEGLLVLEGNWRIGGVKICSTTCIETVMGSAF